MSEENDQLTEAIKKAAFARSKTCYVEDLQPEIIRIKKKVLKWLETSSDCKPFAVELNDKVDQSKAERILRILKEDLLSFDFDLNIEFKLEGSGVFIFTLE